MANCGGGILLAKYRSDRSKAQAELMLSRLKPVGPWVEAIEKWIRDQVLRARVGEVERGEDRA